MPEMNGIELLGHIQRYAPHIGTIMLTMAGEPGDGQHDLGDRCSFSFNNRCKKWYGDPSIE